MSNITDGFETSLPRPAHRADPFLSRAAVLGAGAWGTALASALQRGGVQTTLWARRPEIADAIAALHQNPRHLPGIELPAGHGASAVMARVADGAQLIIIAVPS